MHLGGVPLIACFPELTAQHLLTELPKLGRANGGHVTHSKGSFSSHPAFSVSLGEWKLTDTTRPIMPNVALSPFI